MRGKITKRSVDALMPAADGAETVLWDSELKGFGIRVQRGGAKSYVLHYRVGTGRGAPLRKLTIGRHGSPWTPETARKEAKSLLGMIEDGADPAADKMARRQAPTVTELAERFLAEHAEAKRKSSTATEYRRLLDKIILPALGKRKGADVTRADVSKLHHANRAAPYQANRVLAVLAKMFNLAERWGLRPDGSNPCRHVEKFAEQKRERMLSPSELARLGDAIATYDGSIYTVAAVKLLVFTGARLGEVLGLKWEWIDFDRGEARLPDSKTGAKTLHLPPPALAVLAELPRLDGNPYVIAGAKPSAALVNLEKPWRAMRGAARLDDVRLHDLRHAFASVAASSGMGLPIIGRMLGHSQPATTARYAHLASDPVKAAATAVANKIAASMSATANDGKTVLPICSASERRESGTMNGADETYEEWSARLMQEREASVRTNRVFNEKAVDRIVQKVGKSPSDRGALAAKLERLPQTFAFWDFAKDRPPDGKTDEWFNALEHDLRSVRQRWANPVGGDADILRRSMVMHGLDPDKIEKVLNIFEGLPLATSTVRDIIQDKSYRRGRIESLTAEHWLIGEALPRVYSEHFCGKVGLARNKKTKKPDSPGIRFIVEVLSIMGILDRDGKPLEATAVEHYVKAARLRSQRDGVGER